MRHGVEFVLVGGLASQAHGATRLTEDLDLCPPWTSENLERVPNRVPNSAFLRRTQRPSTPGVYVIFCSMNAEDDGRRHTGRAGDARAVLSVRCRVPLGAAVAA